MLLDNQQSKDQRSGICLVQTTSQQRVADEAVQENTGVQQEGRQSSRDSDYSLRVPGAADARRLVLENHRLLGQLERGEKDQASANG